MTRGRGSKIGGRPVTYFLNGPYTKLRSKFPLLNFCKKLKLSRCNKCTKIISSQKTLVALYEIYGINETIYVKIRQILKKSHQVD